MGGGRRKFPEGAVRLNYLAQARHEVLARVGGHLGRVLAASLGNHMGSIGKKSQIRLAADIKQGMCKGCGGLLEPGVSADVKISKKCKSSGATKWTCYLCNTQKTVFVKPKPKCHKERKKKSAGPAAVKKVTKEAAVSKKSV